jgi:excisionase family DNA binding protein
MEKLFQVTEVAALLQVRPATIYAWVRQGKISHIRLGRLIRFNGKDIDKMTGGKGNEGRSAPPED